MFAFKKRTKKNLGLELLNELYFVIIAHYFCLQDLFAMYGYGLAWPIKHFVPYLYYARFVWYHWDDYCTKSEEINDRICETFTALSMRLGETDCFFKSGYVPTNALYNVAAISTHVVVHTA